MPGSAFTEEPLPFFPPMSAPADLCRSRLVFFVASQESLVIDTPRVRKQTRHYNSFEDDELMEFSELDSDSEEKPCRTRRLGERSRRYLRAECFRVEKNLLIFG